VNRVPKIGKVKLTFPAAFAATLDAKGSDLVTLEKEIETKTTIDNLLSDLASIYADFRKAVFNSDSGTVSDQVHIVLNNNLLQNPEVKAARLNDGDDIFILPVYAGG
jgi:molybdopterin converting factor small subunit